MGVGSIPTEPSGYLQQPAVSLCSDSEMFVGIELNREVHVKAGNNTTTEKSTMKLKMRVTLKLRIVVAAVVGCLLVAPLARAHKHDRCQQFMQIKP
jgi:subtilase family serine protease